MIKKFITYGNEEEGPFFVSYAAREGRFSMIADHFHDYYEMYLLVSGERVYFIKDRTYHIQQGDIVLINKNVVHKTTDPVSMQAPHHERIVCYLFDSFFSGLRPELSQLLKDTFSQTGPVIRFGVQEQLTVEPMVQQLLKELEEQAQGYEMILQHKVLELLLTISRSKLGSRYEQPLNAAEQKISEIVSYINDHYSESFSLQLLAEQFYMSPYYLSRKFKEITGFPLTEYINITRVKEAQRMLKETDLSITAVAEQAGFDNFSHFGKTFKRIAKVSPRSFRNGRN